ncbi:MAG: HK97 gp10 family phage protein [Aliarcobacter butzleri]|nr:HK97 gp10 family phage protein [Aliarcobacter butzleri]
MLKFDFDAFAKQTLNEIGDILVDEAKSNMDKISNGRVYIVGGKTHIASRAGDSPNNLSGNLKKTIRHEVENTTLEFGAGNETINYAKFLEDGTQKMDARPNYTKTILDKKFAIDKVVLKGIKDNIRFKNV